MFDKQVFWSVIAAMLALGVAGAVLSRAVGSRSV